MCIWNHYVLQNGEHISTPICVQLDNTCSQSFDIKIFDVSQDFRLLNWLAIRKWKMSPTGQSVPDDKCSNSQGLWDSLHLLYHFARHILAVLLKIITCDLVVTIFLILSWTPDFLDFRALGVRQWPRIVCVCQPDAYAVIIAAWELTEHKVSRNVWWSFFSSWITIFEKSGTL